MHCISILLCCSENNWKIAIYWDIKFQFIMLNIEFQLYFVFAMYPTFIEYKFFYFLLFKKKNKNNFFEKIIEVKYF